jgi:UTP--glucose-1-phosphate uridylyltransferase
MCVNMEQVSRAHGGASVIAVAPVPADQVSRYGIIGGSCVGSLPGVDAEGEQEGAVWKVTGLVEKPAPEEAPSHLFIVGRYLLSPSIMGLLETQEPGAGGEIQLTDAMAIMARKNSMIAYEFEGTRHDMGSKLGFLKANVSLGVKSEELGEEFSQWLKEFVKTL